MLRVLLISPLLIALAAGIGATVKCWAWLDVRHLAGSAVVGLCFSAIAILGIYMQLKDDCPDQSRRAEVVGRFFRYVGQMAVFLPLFVGGIAAIVVLVKQVLSPILGEEVAGAVYYPLFLGYIAGVIWVLRRLRRRGIIGGKR